MRRLAAVIVTLLVMAALATSVPAHAAPRPIVKATPQLKPDPDGFLLCVVRADSAVKIEVTTRLLTASGGDVTEFGSAFVASPEATGDRRYHVEHDFGTTNDAARLCVVSVRGARKHDLRITVTLESRDASGALLETAGAP
jgi:hypothetical protein